MSAFDEAGFSRWRVPPELCHPWWTDGRNPAKLTVPGADQFLAILMPVRGS